MTPENGRNTPPNDANAQPPDSDPAQLGTTSVGGSLAGKHSVETLIGRGAVDRGLATRDEVLATFEILKRLPREERAARFEGLFVERGVLTAAQITRLRQEITEGLAAGIDEGSKSDSRSGSKGGLAAGEFIPGYKFVRKLGAGAMGTVVLARQLSLDRPVAIKLLPRKFAQDQQFVERFYKEGRAAAKLNDPNIVAAYDVGKAGEHYYFVMEFIDGDTVYDRIQAQRRISEADALDYVRQAASALKHAHECGFIHRDVKPKNLMINTAGVVKLADLGLARADNDESAVAQEQGKIFGTPYYISPEQIRSRPVTPATDLYGLGATFYHMVTGRVPFEASSAREVMQKHLKEHLTPPDQLVPKLSGGTSMIIEMLMAKDPRDRYQNAADLIEDLDRVADGESPAHARPKIDSAEHVQMDHADLEPSQLQSAPTSGGLLSSRAGIALIVLLGLSLAANLILLLVSMRANR
ncbi:MAG: serine/threonine protein kinase [Phycisphaerae bacterium]|nr:serine/threonine protein kinase [Phycisphaerae bacterium]